MLAILGIVVITAIIVIIDVPPLLRNKLYKELGVFSVILLAAVGLSLSLALKVKVPNPLDLMILVYKPIATWVEILLK